MKALGWTMLVLLIIVSGVGLFNWWTEAEHDKSAYEYVQDEWNWFGGSEDDKEIVVEDETGTVEATASINF